MVRLYVTYGNGYAQRNCYSIVEGEDFTDCFRQIERRTGNRYAFAYDEKGFEGQVERWGLRLIPLQPHDVFKVQETEASPYADEKARQSSRFD